MGPLPNSVYVGFRRIFTISEAVTHTRRQIAMIDGNKCRPVIRDFMTAIPVH